MLFRQAKDLRRYKDITTLDDRLRGLMTILVRKKMMGKKNFINTNTNTLKNNNSSNSNNNINKNSSRRGRNQQQIIIRTRTLLEILGREKFSHCQELVHKLRLAMNTKVAQLKCSMYNNNGGKVCGRMFGTELPKAVRVLYFETLLVTAFDRYPLCRLPNVNWDTLIKQAEINLKEFYSWEEKDHHHEEEDDNNNKEEEGRDSKQQQYHQPRQTPNE